MRGVWIDGAIAGERRGLRPVGAGFEREEFGCAGIMLKVYRRHWQHHNTQFNSENLTIDGACYRLVAACTTEETRLRVKRALTESYP